MLADNELLSTLTTPTAVVCSLLCVLVALPWLVKACNSNSNSNNNKRNTNDVSNTIPFAPGAVPLLGHALRYKQDPAGFLRAASIVGGSSSSSSSGLFRLNLAGQEMIVVTNRNMARQVARQPDSVLSLRRAVQDYGFGETLGKNNVFQGTEFHKQVIRRQEGVFATRHGFAAWTATVRTAMEQALQRQRVVGSSTTTTTTTNENSNNNTATRSTIPDLFEFTRRILVHVVLQAMVGLSKEAISADLVDDILAWQNRVEDATAATAVLPRWLAHWGVLRPTRACRLALQQKIVAILLLHKQSNQFSTTTKGPWLQAFSECNDLSLEHQAEYILGLLFATAKNPALGAAQTLCFLMANENGLVEKVRQESAAWLSSSHDETSNKDLTATCPIGVACIREATRLTALAIGSIRKVQKPLSLTIAETGQVLTLQPGETVATSLLLPNTDPKEWGENATEFRPERFLPETQASLSKDQKNPPLLTFSQGTHHCPGERLAMVLMHTYVSLMLCQCDMQSAGPIPDLSWERATVAQRKGPVPVSIQGKNKDDSK